jgi:hypothetical protein
MLNATAARTRFWWLPYLYLLRVQIITALLLVLLPPFALSSTLLNGLFDLDYANPWHSAFGMLLVSLAAFATAWSLLATCWAAIFNAPERFGTARISSVTFPIQWAERGVFGLMALPMIVSAILHSHRESAVSVWALSAGAVGGLAVAIAALLWINKTARWHEREIQKAHPRTLMARFLRRLILWVATKENIREGFIEPGTTTLRSGHMIAWVAFFCSSTLYVAIGISKYARLGYPTYVSTLACVLLLILVLCWLAAGVAFFFDRYRVPMLVPLLILPFVTAWLPWSDHFFRTDAHDEGYSPTAAKVLALSDAPVIVIAVSGGGIQAAAWAARVLTGLDAALRPELGDAYARSIRMISSVSGGGVGVMFFLDKYDNGVLNAGELGTVVKQADASSLDEVAWGAAYPDLLRAFFPLPFRSTRIDRGQALEWAWAAHDAKVKTRMGQWRDDVSNGRRPSNIFNATLVDTGERLLIGSTRVGWSEHAGLRNFEDLHPTADVQVVTAARLSSGFTYVSPATRSDLPGPDFHVVDGGYYDNYGMSTLMAWLQQGLEDGGGVVKHVMVVQIRGAPSGSRTKPGGWQGWFYQAWAPLEAMLEVRTTGQRSHNDEEFQRLQALWCRQGVKIETVVFEFQGDRAPLSWHLTGGDKKRLDEEWARESRGANLNLVRQFLNQEKLGASDPAAYQKLLQCPPK